MDSSFSSFMDGLLEVSAAEAPAEGFAFGDEAGVPHEPKLVVLPDAGGDSSRSG